MQDKTGTGGHHSVKDVSMKKIEERDRRKMDEMKKKLHTDDEGNVLKNHDECTLALIAVQNTQLFRTTSEMRFSMTSTCV